MNRATLVIPDNATIRPKSELKDETDIPTPKRTRYYSSGQIVTDFAEVDKWSEDGLNLLISLVNRADGGVSNELADIHPNRPHGDNLPSNGQRTIRLHDPGSKSRSGTVRVYAADGTLQAELTSRGKQVLWCSWDYARKHGIAENMDIPTDDVQTVTDLTNLAIGAIGWDQDNRS